MLMAWKSDLQRSHYCLADSVCKAFFSMTTAAPPKQLVAPDARAVPLLRQRSAGTREGRAELTQLTAAFFVDVFRCCFGGKLAQGIERVGNIGAAVGSDRVFQVPQLQKSLALGPGAG